MTTFRMTLNVLEQYIAKHKKWAKMVFQLGLCTINDAREKIIMTIPMDAFKIH